MITDLPCRACGKYQDFQKLRLVTISIDEGTRYNIAFCPDSLTCKEIALKKAQEGVKFIFEMCPLSVPWTKAKD